MGKKTGFLQFIFLVYKLIISEIVFLYRNINIITINPKIKYYE